MAARMARDHEDCRAYRLKPAEAWWLTFGRLIQALLANFFQKRVSLLSQSLEGLQYLVEWRIERSVIDRLASPVEQRLPMFDWIGRPAKQVKA